MPSEEEGGHCLKPSFLDTINLKYRSDENGNEGNFEADNVDEMDKRFLSLVKFIEVNQEELQSMRKLCDVFKKMLVSEFPNVKVEPYGSTASKLGLRGCDLDVHIDLGQSTDEEFNVRLGMWGDKVSTRKVAEVLLQHGSRRFRSARAVLASTPIVRLRDGVTGIRCDINATTRMGVLNSRYIKFCASFDPRARILMMVVKCFSTKHRLIGGGKSGHLNSYTLVLMVIFFLQTRGVLHPLHILQDVPGLQQQIINDYNFAFSGDTRALPTLCQNSDSIVELLEAFFQYFSSFPFKVLAISPLAGEPVSLLGLLHGAPLPPSLQDRNIFRGQQRLRLDRALVVQDPFEVRRNVAQGVSHKHLLNLSLPSPPLPGS